MPIQVPLDKMNGHPHASRLVKAVEIRRAVNYSLARERPASRRKVNLTDIL